MLILPPPWEGLHPAFPQRPEPFYTTSLTNAPVEGGTIGLAWATAATLFRRSPMSGVKAAAYATLTCAAFHVASEQFVGRVVVTPFLESKGITIPRQKIITRPFVFDENSFIVAGGIAGVLLARTIARPWSVTGWKRAVGAFSIGAFVGDLSSYAFYWRQIEPTAEKVRQQKALQAMYQDEVSDFRRQRLAIKYGSHFDLSATTTTTTTPTSQDTPNAAPSAMGATTMHQLLGDLKRAAEDALEKTDAYDGPTAQELDEKDPQPHMSDMRDGERTFHPETNYDWSGTVGDLQSHIDSLRARRQKLKAEAELLWHKIARNEAEYLALPTSDQHHHDQDRMRLKLMNHLHVNSYLEISELDWMIADSQKRQLQLQRSPQDPWIPPAPETAALPSPSGTPTAPHTLKLLSELAAENAFSIAEAQSLLQYAQMALQDPTLTALDPRTGKMVADPHAAAKEDIDRIEKTSRELLIMKDAIQALARELGGIPDDTQPKDDPHGHDGGNSGFGFWGKGS